MRKSDLQINLDYHIEDIKGIRGFLVKKVWPSIKDILIDAIMDFAVYTAQQIQTLLENRISEMKGGKGILIKLIWPVIRKTVMTVVNGLKEN